MREGTINDKR